MEVINPFIRDNQQRMVMFIDELSVSTLFIHVSSTPVLLHKEAFKSRPVFLYALVCEFSHQPC